MCDGIVAPNIHEERRRARNRLSRARREALKGMDKVIDPELEGAPDTTIPEVTRDEEAIHDALAREHAQLLERMRIRDEEFE